jgi:hypothetical protein
MACQAIAWLLVTIGLPSLASIASTTVAPRSPVQERKIPSTSGASSASAASTMLAGAIAAISASEPLSKAPKAAMSRPRAVKYSTTRRLTS